jgi:hypothetical protein
VEKIKAASEDFRYLLDRGYRRSTALNFICGHYKLKKPERNILVRTVYSKKEIKDHKRRLISIEKIKGKAVVVDCYNVLIGTECVLGRGQIIESQDGFHRDSLGIFGRYKYSLYTEPAIEKILTTLKKNEPKEVLFLLDSQVSKSGDLALFIRRKMGEAGLKGDAITTHNVDFEIKTRNQIAATSDTAIIEKVKKVVDLVGAIV